MLESKKNRVGIGFATGRKGFQKILKTNVYNWRESGVTDRNNVDLCLFVAYDLKYSDTKRTDYTNIREDVRELIDETCFIGNTLMKAEIATMIDEGVIDESEADILFRKGYAGKRNSVLYMAMKNKIDYLLFLDDDEYPMAVSEADSSINWEGQQVLTTHLKYIIDSDITNGHHCGYISPIPHIEFSEVLNEDDFRLFIEAISNDIVKWDTVRSAMKNGGVTYANQNVLGNLEAEEVEETNHCKFISGANLCINLTKPERVSPFYNPPEARGEDTFLSTCLSDKKVLRVPCYAFHDGFSVYRHIMDGVLPVDLKRIEANSEKVITRFYRACIGWIRYKPLLIYITQREQYEGKIAEMRSKLEKTLPNVCSHFNKPEFMNILKELNKYDRNVKKHYNQYVRTQETWTKITKYLALQK
ncbi:MAG: hypothetical protein GX984_04215 [Erysipelothrix sp.]|nr:hypothetical protein [Erysipelothrix sp.]